MTTTAEALARGMRIVGEELSDVTEERAPGDVQAVYSDIQQRLRVPVVNFVFRTAANEPQWLRCAWQGVREAVSTPAFERAADALRPEGTLPTDLDPAVAGAADDEARAYILPKLLLVTSAWSTALAGRGSNGSKPRRLEGSLPRGVAEGTRNVSMVDPRDGGPPGRRRRPHESGCCAITPPRRGHPELDATRPNSNIRLKTR